MLKWLVLPTLVVAVTSVCSDVRFVTRQEWGARPPTNTTPLDLPAIKSIVHHTAASHCYDQDSCAAICRAIQDNHMDSYGWSDIAYNFLIGEDGNVYEGRGWEVRSTSTSGDVYNDDGHTMCVIGTFMEDNPNDPALDMLQALVDCGIGEGHIASDYDLHGHRSGGCTACPGDYFYANWVQIHPHYGGSLPSDCNKMERDPLAETTEWQQ